MAINKKGEIPSAIPKGIKARTVAAWLYNRIAMMNRAIPNNQGICVTIPSIDPFSSVIFPCKKVSPIQAIPKIATTACIPAEKTLPWAALIPLAFVNNKIKAAADNIRISIIEAISTGFPSIIWEGRRLSKDPKITMKTVAITKIRTESKALCLLPISLSS